MYKLKDLKVICYEYEEITEELVVEFCNENYLEFDFIQHSHTCCATAFAVVHPASGNGYMLNQGVKYFVTEELIIPFSEVASYE
jgi:hypothetical protein